MKDKSIEKKVENKEDVIQIPVGAYLSKVRSNPWILSTFVFALILVIVLFSKGGVSGNVVSEESAGDKLVSFINSQSKGEAEIVSVNREGELYKVIVNFNGQEVPVYTTLDGEYLIAQPIPLSGGAVDSGQNKPSEVVNVELGDSPVQGSGEAKVIMVEFSDYQCPFCGKFYSESYSSLKKEYIDTGKVRLVFKDFPLDFHPEAQKAAEAARCVREQISDVGYWRMHDKLFENQESLSLENYKKWARELDLDGKKFDSCLDSGKYADKVKADLAYGQQLGVSGTPSFFVNGKVIEGAQPYSVIKQIIDRELNSI